MSVSHRQTNAKIENLFSSAKKLERFFLAIYFSLVLFFMVKPRCLSFKGAPLVRA
jgi:hypothetical protein